MPKRASTLSRSAGELRLQVVEHRRHRLLEQLARTRDSSGRLAQHVRLDDALEEDPPSAGLDQARVRVLLEEERPREVGRRRPGTARAPDASSRGRRRSPTSPAPRPRRRAGPGSCPSGGARAAPGSWEAAPAARSRRGCPSPRARCGPCARTGTAGRRRASWRPPGRRAALCPDDVRARAPENSQLQRRAQQRVEPQRARTAALGAVDRAVVELDARARGAQQQPAAAHVAAADEVAREEQGAAERARAARRRTSASRCCRAARPRRRAASARAQRPRVVAQRLRVAAARRRRSARARRRAGRASRIGVSGATSPRSGGDHEHAGAAVGRRREALRVGELAAEVERGEEAEDLAERSAVAAQAPASAKRAPRASRSCAALARRARRREQEHAMRHAGAACTRRRAQRDAPHRG